MQDGLTNHINLILLKIFRVRKQRVWNRDTSNLNELDRMCIEKMDNIHPDTF